MRRTTLIVASTAVVTSALTSFTVAAATGGQERRATVADDAASPPRTRLPVIVDTNVDCGTPPAGQPWGSQAALERTVRCLEQEIVNVNRFMKAFFRCSRIFPVTRYGDDPRGGSFGYAWRGPGEEFLTTALDYTVDPSVDTFRYFVLWRDTTFCTT